MGNQAFTLFKQVGSTREHDKTNSSSLALFHSYYIKQHQSVY